MNAITRWEPFQDLMDIQRTMDRFVRSGLLNPDEMQPPAMQVDISETPDAYEITASMPGVKPEDIEITLDNNTLTISGEVFDEQEKENKKYHVRERRVGVFARSIILPSNVDVNAVDARLENGVMKLHLPKTEEAKTKHIQVHDGNEPTKNGDGSNTSAEQARSAKAKENQS